MVVLRSLDISPHQGHKLRDRQMTQQRHTVHDPHSPKMEITKMIVPEMPLVEPAGALDATYPKKRKHGVTFLSLDSLSIDWFDIIDKSDIFDIIPTPMQKIPMVEAGEGQPRRSQ